MISKPNPQQIFPNSMEPYCILKTTDGFDVLLNLEDYIKASKLSWHIHKMPNYRRVYHKELDGRSTYLHRYILNPASDEMVDHINGDTLDNRRINLRITDAKGNGRNHGLNKNNTTGYKGVSLQSKTNTFRAYICVNRKQINLGQYKTAKEAALKYNEAALKYFGEYARLNNI